MATRAVILFLVMLTVTANIAVASTVTLTVLSRRSAPARRRLTALRELSTESGLQLAWLVAAVATAGSLYFSEVARFTPCELCWYQRIAMYPLVIILGVAVLHRDLDVRRYVLPVVAVGGVISAYHYQLERFPQQASFGCSVEVPCTLVWVWELGYISIPFMALSAFALIATTLLLAGSPDPTSADPAEPRPFVEGKV